MAIDPKKTQTTNPFVQEGGQDPGGDAVQRHLQDQHHEISDEDIRSVRVGVDEDEPVTTGAELQARLEEDEEEGDDNDRPITPWDVAK